MVAQTYTGGPVHTHTMGALLTAHRGCNTMMVYQATELASEKQAEFACLSYSAIARHPMMLKRFDPREVFLSSNIVTLVYHCGELQLGMYAVPHKIETRRSLLCKGLVSTQSHTSGLVPSMISATFQADAAILGSFSDGKAVARITPDNNVNVASSLNFSRVGFYAARVYEEQIRIENIHRVISGSRESHGMFTRAVLLKAKARDISLRVNSVLSDWNITYR